MNFRKILTILIVAAVVGFIAYKVWDLALNRPPELVQALSRRPYSETFARVDGEVFPRVLAHARQIAAFGSRQTGQPGCSLAMEYVESRLREMGFAEVKKSETDVTAPVERECSVSVECVPGVETMFAAHALAPNNAQTSPTPAGGITGPLVYLGAGTADEWNGRDVRGGIAVLEFDSGDAWLEAIGRGAKAVVLLEPPETTTRQADEKYIDLLPLKATRVYVWGRAAEDIRSLAREGKPGRVVSRQSLEVVKAASLEVIVPGTDASARMIEITCHVDARSIVPEMSFGGDELWGAATWLELARWFKANPARNTVRFVAFTGHWQDFAAERERVAGRLDEIGSPLVLALGLDLSTEQPTLALVPDGWPQRGTWRGAWRWLEKLIWSFPAEPRQNWLADIRSDTGRRIDLYGGAPPAYPWTSCHLGTEALANPASLSGRFYVSNEAWQEAGLLSAAWQTSELRRHRHFTPLDTFDASWEWRDNLRPQLELLVSLLDNIMNIPAEYFPHHQAHRAGPSSDGGYMEFRGQIKRYDPKTAWYKGGPPPGLDGQPLGNTFVYVFPWNVQAREFPQTAAQWVPLAPTKHQHRSMQCRAVRYLQKVNDRGEFSLKAVYYQNKDTRYTFVAFSLDDEGNVLWASDLGRYGADEFKYLARPAEGWSIDQSVTVFPCGSVALFDLVDMRRYSIGKNLKDTWYVQWGEGDSQNQDAGLECWLPVSEVKLHPSQTDAKSYLVAQYQKTAMVFLPADTSCEVLLTRGPLAKFSLVRSLDPAVFAGAAADNASRLGGIRFLQGEGRLLTETPLVIARQMHLIDGEKLREYGAYGVRSQEADQYFARAATYIDKAQKAESDGRERAYRSASAMAWSDESRAYSGRFSLLYDVVSTTIFYFTLLIPFSYLVERLLFPQPTGLRTSCVAAAVFLVFVAILLEFHPGFKLAGNIYVAIVSFLIIIFTLPAFFMIVGQGLRMLKAAGSQYFQRHASEAERLGVLVAALSLSIANMRRRKLRTALTLGTISLLVLSLVLLTHTTSTSTTYPTNEPPKWDKMPYEGVQVYNTRYHTNALFRELVGLMEDTLHDQAIVLPRWYVHYGVRSNLKGYESVRLCGPHRSKPFTFYDILGRDPSFVETTAAPFAVGGKLDYLAAVARADNAPKSWVPMPSIFYGYPEETQVTHIDHTLVSGRWFTPDDVESVIVSRDVADRLGAEVGDTMEIEGFRVTLVGIFDAKKMDALRDVGGDQIVPIAFEQNQPTPEEPTRYAAGRVAFMPYRFHERYGYFPAAPYSVVIVPKDHAEIPKIADELSKNFDNIDVYAGYQGKLNLISAFHTARVTGGGLMLMPLLVSFLMIFSVMMGSVHERTREIYIFSSVGLSPRHVAGMFLVESVVYAGIASVWGYFLGIILLHVFRVEGMLPATFYPNYLGVFVIYSVGLAMLATVSSSLYPMYKAARIANPSLERTWRIDTAPEEDRWTIDFPFISNRQAETRGILAFLREYVEHHAGEGMGVFAVQGPIVYEEDPARHDCRLLFKVWLAPFERNITQEVVFEAVKDPTRPRWSFRFRLRHLTGVRYMWVKSNKSFVDAFRKQMLVWRGFPDEAVEEYAKRGEKMVSGAS